MNDFFQPFRALRFLAIFLMAAKAFGADTPITPGASPQAQSLLSYFSDIYGKKIISGQQEGWRGTNEFSFELNDIKNATGKLPELLALDFSPYTAPNHDTNHLLVKYAKDWYENRNGIVAFCWHWRAPVGEHAFYTKDTKFDLARGVIPGTPEYDGLERDLDTIAGELEGLRDAHVPVVWRPMHEVNGRWFWWGAQGPEPYKKLWRMMYENFTVKHRLNNLLWVFSPGAETDLAAWYPGDQYVDLIGQDFYPMDGNHGAIKDVFNELTALGRGTKMVALSENGPIPDPAELVKEKAGWLFFTTWSGNVLTQNNSREQLKQFFNNPYVLNLGEVPDLKNYPFHPAGKAVRLGFPAPPGGVAIGGERRLPVTVAIEDKNGRTVRAGNFTVTLALKNSSKGALTGNLTTAATNGVATFSDAKIDRAGKNYKFVATAKGLRKAVSAPFEVGPGAGIEREWWTNFTGDKLTDVDNFAAPPAGREILGKAFESPMKLATNFAARYRGYLIPPMTGAYKFWLANESVSELWISTNASPAGKIEITAVTRATPYSKWPHTHESESGAANLEAGKRYYLEAWQEQNAGSTQFAVRWQLPNGVEERPIPARRFIPLAEASNNSTNSVAQAK